MVEPSEQSHIHHHCLLPQDRIFGMMGILSPLQYQAFGENFFAITDAESESL